jgi:hypothetical protein
MWWMFFAVRILESDGRLHGVYIVQPDHCYVGMAFPGHKHIDHLDTNEQALPAIDLGAVAAELLTLHPGALIGPEQPAALRLAERIAESKRHVFAWFDRRTILLDFASHADRETTDFLLSELENHRA